VTSAINPHRDAQKGRSCYLEEKEVLDAALAAAGQAVEHYEIARYGTLIAWAKQLGRNDCATLLETSLEEEKAADKKLRPQYRVAPA
jgi:ferritin-like metal-binding protein YciE